MIYLHQYDILFLMEQDIANIGLSDKEAKIYVTALELGESSITDIARKSGQKRSTTHLAIEHLIMLGLLAETVKGKRRVISPIHPKRLVEIANLRARQVEEKLGSLVALYNTPKEKPKIQVFEGNEGVKNVYRDIYASLNNKEELLGFTRIDALRDFSESVNGWMKMLRSVRDPHIRELNWDNSEGQKWNEETKILRGKNHHIRMFPTDFEFGFNDNLIFGNKLAIFSLKKNIFVTVIESEEIIKTYKTLFEWAWKSGKDIV